MARLHPNEIQRLLKGAEIREERKNRAAERGSAPSADQRRREQEALENFA